MSQQNSIQHRGISAELLNELFASMPLENAFVLLAKMSNGLLARNVQKMINLIKEAMKNNKLNEEDCGSKIEIYEDGLVAKHSADGPFELNCLRTILPIPTFLKPINKPRIAFYLEIEILNAGYGITIGFCDSQFPLEDKELGINYNSNSIGILRKHEIEIEGRLRSLGEDNYNNEGFLVKDDCIGIGIIHLPNEKMEFFATWNSDLLGKVELTPKFVDLQLFPAFNLFCYVDSVRVHFKKEEWQFNDFKSILE